MTKPYRVTLDQGDSYMVELPDGTSRCSGFTAEGPHDLGERHEACERIYKDWLDGLRESDRKLYLAFREIGCSDLARRAAQGEWNDYFGKHAMTQHHLLAEVNIAMHTIVRDAVAGDEHPGTEFQDRVFKCMGLIELVKEGAFDASKAEAAEWADSPEGIEIKADLGPAMSKVIFGKSK